MVHAFMLMVVIGAVSFVRYNRTLCIFKDYMTVCTTQKEQSSSTQKNYPWDAHVDPRDRVTAYCKPVYVEKGT